MSGAKDATIAETYKDRLNALRNGGGRKILGIVGPPGCGKSTLAAALLDLLGDDAVAVPMDGYHLANVELAMSLAEQAAANINQGGLFDDFDDSVAPPSAHPSRVRLRGEADGRLRRRKAA